MSATMVQDNSTKQLLERMVASRQLSSLDADALLRAQPHVAGEEEILRWLAHEYGLGYTTLDDVEPIVLRRIEVPADIKLDRLHLTLQAALGWTNSHLFEIRARDVGWGLPSPDWPDGPLDARKAKLIDVLEDAGTKTLRYLYDYGDGWEHSIKVERLIPAETNIAYPRLIEASGRCPPEGASRPAESPQPRQPFACRRDGTGR